VKFVVIVTNLWFVINLHLNIKLMIFFNHFTFKWAIHFRAL